MTAIRPHPGVRSLADDLLEEVRAYGIPEVSMGRYRSACSRIVSIARGCGHDEWSDALEAEVSSALDELAATGGICAGYRRFHARVIRMLSSLANTGEVDFSRAPMPTAKYPVDEATSGLVESVLDDRLDSDGARDDLRAPVRHLLWYAAERGVAPLEIDDALVMEFLVREVPVTNGGSTGRTLRAVRLATEWLRGHGASRLLRDYSLLTLRNERRRIIPAFTESEVGAILRSIGTEEARDLRDRAIIMLAYCTGLRSGDICGVRLSDVDWRGQSLTVSQSKTHETITCELNGETMNALADYVLRARPDVGRRELFLSAHAPYGPLGGYLTGMLDRRCAAAGVEKLPGRGAHSLRRAFETTLVSKGVRIETASQMMGHKTIEEDKPYVTHDRRSASLVALGFGDVPIRAGRYLEPAEGGGEP